VTGRRAERLEFDDRRWLEFIARHPSASAFHHPQWLGLVSRTYRRNGFCAVIGSDRVQAGLPLVEFRRPRRIRWVALPFTDVCNVLYEPGFAPREFFAALDDLRHEAGVESVELFMDLPVDLPPAARTELTGVTHRLTLSRDEALRAVRPSARRNVKQAERNGVVVREGASHDEFDLFWNMHVRTRRRQGVPVQPNRFKENLWSDVLSQGLGFVLLAWKDDEAAAGAVFLDWNTTLIYKFGASRREFLALRPNHALFSAAILKASSEGRSDLHFGKTDLDNTGLRRFKKTWGARETPLVRITLGRQTRDGPLRRYAPGMRGVIRRSPLWVTEIIGALAYRRAA
jgi:Acetyltransferase (GNAT) domain